MIFAGQKMWSGRFREPTDKFVQKFTSSIWFDKVLCYCDVKVLNAYNRMLWLSNVVRTQEFLLIEAGLDDLLWEVRSCNLPWKIELEDVHRTIETRLTQLIGRPGKKIHTGKSRNDQVVTVLRLWVRQKVGSTILTLKLVLGKLILLAKRHVNVVFPGMTHSQIAQPVTFGHYVLSYGEMLRRDISKLRGCVRRARDLPLGCAALAGSNYKTNRMVVADVLGFDKLCHNSIDAVSDRDFVIEFLFCGAMVMVHLSRLSEELITWFGPAGKIITISDSCCTGSSIMPQKKNPDVLELIRGKSGRSIGNLVGMLVTMKAQSLAYNKDNQEDKRITFEGADIVMKSTRVLDNILTVIKLNFHQAKGTASSNFSTATDLADYLVEQGLTFRDAHEVTSRIVNVCSLEDTSLVKLNPRMLKGLVPYSLWSKINERSFLKVQYSVSSKNHIGGTSPKWLFRMISYVTQ